MTKLADFTSHRIEGFVNQTGKPLSVPLFTEVAKNLWMGGAPVVALPKEFTFAIDLYGHQDYELHPGQIRVVAPLLDSRSAPLDHDLLHMLASLVDDFRGRGVTLVHCQAGLNRSGLITAMALVKRGMEPQAAIDHLRAKRDEHVLCNTTFANWLLGKPLGHDVDPWRS